MRHKILSILVAAVMASVCLFSGWPPHFEGARADVPITSIGNGRTFTANNQCWSINPQVGQSSATASITTIGTATVAVSGQTGDGTWDTISDTNGVASITTNSVHYYGLGTYTSIRICTTAWTSGTVHVTFVSSAANGLQAAGGGGPTQNVAIVSPNPLHVTQDGTPAPSPVPTAVSTLPATVAGGWHYTLTGCSPIATPSPGAGTNTTVVDQCNSKGHKIVDLEPGTTFSFGGLQTPLPTPSPTAPPNGLGVVAVPHAYVGSNLIEAMVQCLAAPLHADPVTATDTTIIAGSGTLRIYLCGSRQSASGTNTGYLEQSTSASCASGFTQIDDTFDFIANNGFVDHLQYAYYALPAGNSLCYHTTSTGQVRVTVYAVQF